MLLTTDFIDDVLIKDLLKRREKYNDLSLFHLFLPQWYNNTNPINMYTNYIHKICNTLNINYGRHIVSDNNILLEELNFIKEFDDDDTISGILIDAPFNNRDYIHMWNPDMKHCKDIELFYSSYHNHMLHTLESPYVYAVNKIKYFHGLDNHSDMTIFTNWNRSHGKIIPLVDYGFNKYTLNNFCNIKGLYSSDIVISLTELLDSHGNATIEYDYIRKCPIKLKSKIILDFNSINNSEGSPFKYLRLDDDIPVYGWTDILMKLYIIGFIENLFKLMDEKESK